MLKMHFHGHSCWEIADESHRVLIDRVAGSLTDEAQRDTFLNSTHIQEIRQDALYTLRLRT